jgi:hypothetical protein
MMFKRLKSPAVPALIIFVLITYPGRAVRSSGDRQAMSLSHLLSVRIREFGGENASMAHILVHLAYSQHLPIALEYIDHAALAAHPTPRLRGVTVGEALRTIVAVCPEYSVDVSHGVVEIYSPLARRDGSNLLNTIIPRFTVTNLDAGVASAALLDAVFAQRRPGMSVAHSVAGVGGERLSLSVMNMPVYAILNKIIALQGGSIWTVTVPPQKLSEPKDTPWHAYPLDPAYESIVMGVLGEIFPR